MNGRTAKMLRRAARQELIEKPIERELVASPKSRKVGVNNPNSQRGMYLALKKAWKAATKRI